MIILGTNSIKDTGYDVANSLRFDTASDDYLNRTVGTPTQSLKYTISTWVKRSVQSTGVNNGILGIGNNGSSNAALRFKTNDTLQFYDHVSNADQVNYVTNRVFRDLSAWYHIVISSDRSISSPETKIFINGVQETSFSTSTEYNQNDDANWNTNGKVLYVGSYNASNDHIDGYLAELVFIDGSILAPTEFGEFDEDSAIWKPKDVSGLTFGDQGFYLDFEDSSALGNDAAGSNNFTVNNLTAIDQSTDTCTNNFATLNGLHKIDDWSLAQGNLEFTNISTGYRMTNSTIAVSQGKWYAEVKIDTVGQSQSIGVINPDSFLYNTYFHNVGRGYGYKSNDGNKVFNDSTNASYGNSYTTGDIVGIAMDLDNHKLYFSKNGTFQNSGDPTSGSTGTGSAFDLVTGVSYTFGQTTQDGGTDPVTSWNFGSPPFSISSGNTDGNGYGNFEYAVPSGYYSLNTKNLAEYG